MKNTRTNTSHRREHTFVIGDVDDEANTDGDGTLWLRRHHTPWARQAAVRLAMRSQAFVVE